MRMRNRDRFAKEHSGTPSDSPSHELGEIEVLYLNVVDKEKLKELSVNMQLIEANSSQTMVVSGDFALLALYLSSLSLC